jgi:hypothetical protein
MRLRLLLTVSLLVVMAPAADAQVQPPPGETALLTDTFLEWASPGREDRSRYVAPGVNPGTRPTISRAYAAAHFVGFSSAPKKICPMIKGRCDAYIEGRELTFGVVVSGHELPGGAVQFTADGRIVAYTGPYSEITRVIAPAEARKRAVAGCTERGLEVSGKAHDFTSYQRADDFGARSAARSEEVPADSQGLLMYRFRMEGRIPGCLGAFCTVDAVTGTTKMTYMCMGALPPGR